MPEERSLARPDDPVVEWYVEASRELLEAWLAIQQSSIDAWASALDGGTTNRRDEATPAREGAWLYDVWAEVVRHTLVHLDDAITEEGVDLEELRTILLHTSDDALTDVGRTPEFATTMARSVERTLTGQYWLTELRRAALQTMDVPTDRSVERVGAHLLDLEYRQKLIEDRVDSVLAAVESTGGRRSPGDVQSPPEGGG